MTMVDDGFFNWSKAQVDQLTKRFKLSEILKGFKGLFGDMDVTEFFGELDYKEKLGFYDSFDKFFGDLVWTYLSWRFRFTATEQI
jgi:hypothetical protein